jgi:hypothetical protein
MLENLTEEQLKQLIQKVFAPKIDDRALLILVDVPNTKVSDNEVWKDRRALAFAWSESLEKIKRDLGLEEVKIIYYENTGSNNAELPPEAFLWPGDPKWVDINKLKTEGQSKNFEQLLSSSDIVLAPTQFSATAPLKVLARKHNFRGATMPGFKRERIPALEIDYEKVHAEVMKLKTRLDEAVGIEMDFTVEGVDYKLMVDLRNRTAHASSGLLREPCQVGNLPSGEAYIVPYEGELEDESKTSGHLPVQFGDEIVVYNVRNNRAVEVTSTGSASQVERTKLAEEPAYGNLAEIGFGVLEPFGIKPIGEILLDEKLGLHIAFGRSDHFGGATSPQHFKNPKNVIHIDRIYIPEVQSKVGVKEVVFLYPDQRTELIMQEGQYCL